MEQQGTSIITSELALRWALQPRNVQPAHWAARLSFVRSFARYWSATDPRTEIPPTGLLPYRYKRATPYIYSDEEIQRILKAAKSLPPSTGLRSWTYYTLFGLMAVTGMRISEIVHLDTGDVDLDQQLLTVRLTKFSKSRLIPLHPFTVKKLILYRERRGQLYPRPSTSRFFLSNQGTPLTDCIVRWTFLRLSRQVALRTVGDSFGPRIHDLRHRFAVTRSSTTVILVSPGDYTPLEGPDGIVFFIRTSIMFAILSLEVTDLVQRCSLTHVVEGCGMTVHELSADIHALEEEPLNMILFLWRVTI